MEINTIEKILNFLQEKEGKELPKKWFDSIEKLKLLKELENHPDGAQYKYKGDLVLNNSTITKLPNDLYVTGCLDLYNCKQLTKLPDNLYVGGFLRLWDCVEITKLPNDLYVGSFLDLDGCKKLTELPDNLFVNGALHITNTPLVKKYTDEEIYKILALTGGRIRGKTYR
jgi:hypothetical protein